MGISERIKIAREQAGISKAELARRVGVTRASAQQWESGETKSLKPENLVAVADTLHVSVRWLATGEGPMRPETKEVELGPPLGNLQTVPVVGTTQAGPDKEWFELGYPPGYGEDYVDVPAKDPHAYALRVVGDSMEPRMHEGELVLVYPSWEAQPGDEVVVRTRRGEVMVKKLVYIRNDRVALDSVSENHGRIERNLEDIEFMHQVVGVLRPASLKRRGK